MYTRALSAVFLISCFMLVQRQVGSPYMDEYFHVNQTWQYTEKNFRYWDPKITTPPGLYIIGFTAAKTLGESLLVLRFSNLIASLLLLLMDSSEMALFPLVAFYGNLYYTDVWSTLLVLQGFKLVSNWGSALCFLASLLFRQTNIVWAGLACAWRVTESSPMSQVLSEIPLFAERLGKSWPYIIVAAVFFIFVGWNGGIALGDKTNHEISLHGAQILYFLMFFGIFSFPLALNWIRTRQFVRRWYLIPIELAVINGLIKYGTIVHPFILSDNRHYTFYIWRRIITPLNGKLMVPAYLLAWRWLASTLNWRLIKTWLYVGAVLAVLTPSPLMEPRYYIVPYLIWRKYLCGFGSNNLELLWYVMINGLTVVIFCFSATHFMW